MMRQIMAGDIRVEDDLLYASIMGAVDALKRHYPEMDEAHIIDTALTRMEMQVVASTPNTTGRYRNIIEVFRDFGI